MRRIAPLVIARANAGAYVRSMRLVLRFLALLAVLLSPLSMIAPSHAMAPARAPASAAPAGMDHGAAGSHHVAASADAAASRHCAPAESGEPQIPGRSPDCAIACAALPAGDAGLKIRAPLVAILAPLPSASEPRGLEPEAATPPPRSA
jgi:Na+-transporting methylmalonyl-CoA/oxaloacetate decarboxylase gamma subunit